MTGSVARARHALASGDFSQLLATRLLSQFADGVFQAYLVAQIVFLNPEKHNTAIGVAKAYAVLVIPFSVVGPLSGVLIDRWSRRRILIVSPLVKLAGVLALLPVGGSSLYLYVPALLVISVNRFFLTAATSSIPVLVEDRDLLMANSLSTVGGTVVTFIGIVAGTKLVDPIGPRSLLLITAACWAGTALVATRISVSLRPERPPAPMAGELARVLQDLRAGARRLVATPLAIGPITSISLDQFLVGFITVLSLVVFKQRFHQGVGSYGNIVAAGGGGVLAGTLTVGFFESRMAKPRITAMAFALAGLACVAVAPAITGVTILLLSFVLGLTFAWRKIPVDTMVQEAVPDRYRGRVFAVYDITYSMARVAAAGLAIPIIPRVSTGWLVFATGAAYLLWTPVLPRWVRRPVRLRIRFYAGGRADEVPRAIVVAGEEEPVEVVGSWSEERDGVRVRRFRLRADGDLVDVVGTEREETWEVERRVPSGAKPDGAGAGFR